MSKNVLKLIVLLIVSIMMVTAVGCTQTAPEGDQKQGDQADKGGNKNQVVGKIIGIDPGAGIMSTTETALEEYDLNYDIVAGSGATMTAALGDAIESEKWIVVTGWAPHWKFNKWDLKFLDDPKGIYGETEQVNTIARKGFKEDMPEAYAFMDAFHWDPADIQQVMLMNAEKGTTPAGNAKKWVEDNMDRVQEWIPEGFEMGSGQGTVKLGYVEWAGEIASTNVVSEVLKKMGYETDLLPLGAAAMWQGVAEGEFDVMTSAWLPTTHKAYYDKREADIDDLGENMKGTRIGLVVPKYVTIDSIEELNENTEKFQKP
ncbi:glycine/betaine ABC transporter [Metallumcola ferriviriculae]|uniref:Glycine/betaine ABC transporter n=1 Tax=Metallumcola ferriviriculae TaxID=3039180 RepID=A0AAU0UKW6_9FIRM|nr:glycine/betaine ABC transporter [Desulfitibacteraceae bacterium MK1]